MCSEIAGHSSTRTTKRRRRRTARPKVLHPGELVSDSPISPLLHHPFEMNATPACHKPCKSGPARGLAPHTCRRAISVQRSEHSSRFPKRLPPLLHISGMGNGSQARLPPLRVDTPRIFGKLAGSSTGMCFLSPSERALDEISLLDSDSQARVAADRNVGLRLKRPPSQSRRKLSFRTIGCKCSTIHLGSFPIKVLLEIKLWSLSI